MSERLLIVAACALIDVDGRVLIAERPAGKAMAGLWEFPGGKVEAGESLEEARTRELHEELGIAIGRTSALLEVHHDYGDKSVLLEVHVVWEFSGEVHPLEEQPMAWVAPQDLGRYRFPAANMPIVDAVGKMFLP
ncbi:MAG TPA: 8-oxo-dGTP diphosphatase MutT [Halioglobus sp.]